MGASFFDTYVVLTHSKRHRKPQLKVAKTGKKQQKSGISERIKIYKNFYG